MTQDTQVMLTPEGRAMLEARLQELADDVIPSMRPPAGRGRARRAGRGGFERLQAEYDRLVVLLGTSGTLDLASLGVHHVGQPGSRHRRRWRARLIVRIVDPVEAYLDEERISDTAPLALALLGHSVGDECVVVAPASTWTAKVLAVGEEI